MSVHALRSIVFLGLVAAKKRRCTANPERLSHWSILIFKYPTAETQVKDTRVVPNRHSTNYWRTGRELADNRFM